MTSDSAPRGPVQGEAPSAPEVCNPLLLSFVTLFAIGLGVWLVAAVHGYREEYAQATQTWRVGSSRAVELTLVKEDRQNLACASDEVIAGLRCGYGRDLQPADSSSADDPKLLQPYNTIGNELLLGAGLWTSADLRGPLPQRRFVVSCTYHIKGIVKRPAIRFAANGKLAPTGKTITAGTLSDCVLPQ